ncbi:hypothetical protein B0H14DRAFT_3423331 [Mycena olivaceomarginata]|nr:hypothetical protein B0H14DRAFT_3423331 [Mycena olivaceomarginata]
MSAAAISMVHDTVASILDDLTTTIAGGPRPSQSSSQFPLVNWTDQIARRAHDLTAAVEALTVVLSELEVRVTALSAPQASVPSSGGVTPGATSASQPAGRLPRCKKCHARGHSVDECTTTNPAAMRRRVAANSRSARDVRAAQAAHALLPSPFPVAYPSGPIYPTPPIPMELAALAADATELRRRSQQSRRDKRLARVRPPT